MSNERNRQHEQTGGTGPDPFSDGFTSGTAVSEAQIAVIHGVHAHNLPLAGRTVGQARAELSERMNIAPDALAVIDGNTAAEDTVLVEGQVLTFVKHAGEKGSGLQESSGAAETAVTVFCGVRCMSLEHVDGMTVQSLRASLVELLDIPPDSLPIVEQQPAGENQSILPGQTVCFTMLVGEMGGSRVWQEGAPAK